jgi:energy-coupling factor transporter ATP-binding protein EcfA2
MGTARQDFERFIRWLHDAEQRAPESARRFANLVLANFEDVASTAKQHNSRSHRLARLARQQLSNTSPDRPEFQELAPQGEWPWVRLRYLTLGPFRGFREPQGFDLSKRLVLCYGPNGSGKSSLCEALEFALRGSVEGAGSKRIVQSAYLENIHAGRFDAPVLTATGRDGSEVQVRADEDAFRFLFIEQNRIDNFSRIAATPPGRRNDLIATLFGMDEFNEFSSHFNESMDAALTLGTQAQIQLNARRQALVTDEAAIAAEPRKLVALEQAATNYAAAFADGLTYERLRALIGSEETPGRLQELNTRLLTIPPALTGISREHLLELYADADDISKRVSAATQLLNERRNQISFRDLFTAVQILRETDPDHCPACLTVISETEQNPFDRAEAGLRQLGELANLEADHQSLSREQREASRLLRAELRKVEDFLATSGEQETIVFRYLSTVPQNPDALDWWTSVHSPNEARGIPSLEQILEAAERASAQDANARGALAVRDADATEQKRLNDARVWIASLETTRAGVVNDAEAARTRIAEWERANAYLIQRAPQEAEENGRDRPIRDAYDAFYGFLERFREQLPGVLMADLNSTTMELYNEFNEADRDEDKLAELRLPLTGEGTIEIAFRSAPGRRVNALAALSEGHIRCIGLAILLAKAQSVSAPLIVFDDAINAIDHDHRSGIRTAMFESDRFRQTQIIVTCHSPEFVKDVENHLPRESRLDCQQYVLLPHRGDHQPRVNPDVGSANYLARARQALERFDPRDALSYARKALEMFMQKSWKWLESHRVGNISVQIEGPGKEPQLRTLCEAVRTKLDRMPNFAHASKLPLLDNLNAILGIPEQTLVWTLLNKGTHEEPNRDDFDLQHVEIVLRVLESIDRLELRSGR